MINIVIGFIDSLNIFPNFYYLTKTTYFNKIIINLIFYNLFLNIILTNYTVHYIKKFILDNNLKNIYLNLLSYTWVYPNYLFSLFYNSYYQYQLIILYIDNNKLKINSYNHYLDHFVYKVYYLVIISLLQLEVYIISQIPYLGIYLKYILVSYIYSFYCWDIKWSYHQIIYNARFNFFHHYFYYLLGYGFIFGLLKYYLDYLDFYYLVNVIYPLLSINTFMIHVPKNNYYFTTRLFILPIKITHYIVYILTSYLKNNI